MTPRSLSPARPSCPQVTAPTLHLPNGHSQKFSASTSSPTQISTNHLSRMKTVFSLPGNSFVINLQFPQAWDTRKHEASASSPITCLQRKTNLTTSDMALSPSDPLLAFWLPFSVPHLWSFTTGPASLSLSPIHPSYSKMLPDLPS